MWLYSGAWGHLQPCLFQLRPLDLLHRLITQDTMSPPELPGPAPARPQQVWALSPRSPAMPSYACEPESQPGLSQALMPGKCLVPQGAAAALVPCTMGWHRLWLPGPALTNPWGWTCQPAGPWQLHPGVWHFLETFHRENSRTGWISKHFTQVPCMPAATLKWSKPDFQTFRLNAKFLYLYLWSNTLLFVVHLWQKEIPPPPNFLVPHICPVVRLTMLPSVKAVPVWFSWNVSFSPLHTNIAWHLLCSTRFWMLISSSVNNNPRGITW